MNKGQKIHNWIQARLSEGLNVYIATHLKTIKVSKRHAGMFRVRDDHCEIQRGKHWDSINYCRISAQ